MEPEFQPARDPASGRIWREILRPMAREMRLCAPALSHEIVASTFAKFPDLFDIEGSFEENRAATEANITLGARVIEDGSDPASIELPSLAAAYGQESLHRGVPLAALLRGIRLGHAELSRWSSSWLREHVEDARDLAAATALAAAWMFAIADALSTASEAGYALERERWLRSAAAVRTNTIAEILAGHDVDSAAAGRRLRYELDREHVGLIAWVEAAEEGRDTLSMLEASLRTISRASGAIAIVVQPSGLLSSAAWISHTSPPAPGALDGLVLDAASSPGVRVAAGDPAHGPLGFRLTHEQARHARRIAQLSGRPAGTVTSYGPIALQAAVCNDVEQARAFVERALGALAEPDDRTRRLAATLQVYLEEQSSRSRTAKRLGVHENTVSYRIRQAEGLLGHSVAEDTLNLRVALAIAPAALAERDHAG